MHESSSIPRRKAILQLKFAIMLSLYFLFCRYSLFYIVLYMNLAATSDDRIFRQKQRSSMGGNLSAS